jgi:hypothetical protein
MQRAQLAWRTGLVRWLARQHVAYCLGGAPHAVSSVNCVPASAVLHPCVQSSPFVVQLEARQLTAAICNGFLIRFIQTLYNHQNLICPLEKNYRSTPQILKVCP